MILPGTPAVPASGRPLRSFGIFRSTRPALLPQPLALAVATVGRSGHLCSYAAANGLSVSISIVRSETNWIIARSKSVSAPFSTSSASKILPWVVIVGLLGIGKCGNSNLLRLTMTAFSGSLVHHYWGHDPKRRYTLSRSIRVQSAELLNKHLAAAINLQALVRREYWNIRQPRFIAILELFCKISVEARNHSNLIGVAS
jgi:hypothetical protein